MRGTLLLRLESPRRRAAAVAAVVLATGLLGADVVRRAVADEMRARAVTLDDAERAVAWAPGDPAARLLAADAHVEALSGGDLARARTHLEAALRARPTDAAAWLRLATLEARAGRADLARERLATAVRLDPHGVALRWEAALLALRWGDRADALAHFRYVLENDPSRRDAAFQLARTLLPAGAGVETLLPADPAALAAILAVAVRDQDTDLARAAWARRAAMTPPVSPDLQRRLVDLLLAKGEGSVARSLWAGMAPATGGGRAGNAVWNGGFEQGPLLGWGFDWQVRRVWGVEARLDGSQAAEGRQALRLAFNAYPTLDFAGVSQVVPVEGGRAYRLRALVKAQDFVTRSGLKLQVVSHDDERVLGETEPVAGTTDAFVPVEAIVVVPADVSLVRLRLRRERAASPEGNLGGKVWVDDVSLTLAGSRT